MASSSSTLTRPQVSESEPALAARTVSTPASHGNSKLTTKSVYQADQQEKFLNLQAEVESLLQELQRLKQQRIDGSHPSVEGA